LDGGERAGEAFGAQADFDRDVDAELARD
jgi:hypothetical protein